MTAAFQLIPKEARAEYARTYLYAWRRLGKAERVLFRELTRPFLALLDRLSAALRKAKP